MAVMREPVHEICCRWCAAELAPADEVRLVYRELAGSGDRDDEPPRWAYTHLGHEPGGYSVRGRGRLRDLEAMRRQAEEPRPPGSRITGAREPFLPDRPRSPGSPGP
jgi:hypothetical protein